MATSTRELVAYYVNLLIIQYASKPRATATIATQVAPALLPQTSTQLIEFQAPPASGTYKLEYDELLTAAIDWDADATDIQTELRTLPGLADVIVTGSAADGFVVVFEGVLTPAELLIVKDSTIDTGVPTVTETDEILMLAIQNAFDIGSAVGVQLDTLGKYVGVKRTTQGLTGPITLGDDEFRSLIRMAVLTNSAQSDLASIQDLIFTFFNGQMRVYDYQNMRMSYLISSTIGSAELIQMFVAQGLLPRPMSVQVAAIIYAPDINNFFGFCSYENPTPGDVKPFNTYEDYHTDWLWLDYQTAIVI